MTHRQRKYFSIFLLFQLACFPAWSQLEGQLIDQSKESTLPFTIVDYVTKHGLPQNQIQDIVGKKSGNILLSTANGVVEFNGTTFVELNTGNERKVFQTKLFWDEQSKQLIGLEESRRLNTIYPDYEVFAEFCMAEVLQGKITGITAQGHIKQASIHDKVFTDVYQTTIKGAVSIRSVSDGYLISNREKLYYVNPKKKQQYVVSEEPVIQFARNPYSKKLYAVGFQHLYEVVSPNVLKEVPLRINMDSSTEKKWMFTDIAFVDADTYFLSSKIGLVHVDGDRSVLYDTKDSFPSDRFECLWYNKDEECLFVGTGEKGLLKLERKSCFTLGNEETIGKRSLSSVVSDNQGNIFTLGYKGNIYRTDQNGNTSLYIQLPGELATLSLFNGVFYAGSWGEDVYVIRNKKVIGTITGTQLASTSVHAVFQDSHGNIWVGNDEGISKGKTLADIKPHLKKEISEVIVTVYERRDGTICVGGSESVFLIDKTGKLIRKLSVKDGLLCKNVRSFYEDKEGKLWIGTYNGGLYCYDKGKLTSINKKPNCGLNQDAFSLAVHNGLVYMTSNSGLWTVEESKLNDFYYNRIQYLIPFYYGETSGIMNTEFNGGFQNNFAKTKSGDLYFPSIQGLVKKTTGKPKFRKLQVAFRSLSINDTLVQLGKHSFGRLTHTVQFEFYCSNFIPKYNVYYQYRLTGPGLPPVWSKLQKDGNVSFKMLPPGDYKLSVRALDGFNDSSPVTESYAFTIEPFFYETNWFKICGIIAFLLIVIGISRYRIVQIRQKEIKENKINNTILELKLHAIQAKMNPHFIFNSLNNIIYLLDAERYVEAEELLQEFSLLLRKFLENSDNTFIALQEELSILHLYLQIEQKRYNKQFDYQISFPDHLAKYEIPTLLIQPFVENAVKHGVSHLNESGLITIAVRETKKGMEICIEDNGIGIEQSTIINTDRTNHRSRGMELVNEKILIMKEKYNREIRLEVISLPNGKGTLIKLKISFE